ncbi:hypothetical protein [Methylophilus luteus]|uniref:ApeA N-terminal domain-containing protein n=1 Tax=Methylophilus luteus TaxID=640108 RepID=A0ABW3F2J5_9PROT
MGSLLNNGEKPIDVGNLKNSNFVDTLIYEDQSQYSFKYSIPLPGRFFDAGMADVFLLEHTNLPENTIYELRFDGSKQPGGHLMPLSLLESSESDVAKDNYHVYSEEQINRIKAAAFVSVQHFIRKLILDKKLSDEKLNVFTEIFGENTAVLIVTKDADRVQQPFELLRYLPSFFEFGFLYKSDIYANSVNERINDYNIFTLPDTKSVSIRKVSDDFKNLNFLNEVFCKTFPKHWSPIISFFLCYQIIEVLIEEIRKLNNVTFLNDLSSSIEDRVKSEGVIRDYQRVTSEKARIKKLIGDHLPNTSINQVDELPTCLSFLSAVNQKEDHVADNIYTVRNYFFHAFSVVTEQTQNTENLTKISWEIFLVTLKILLNYHSAPPTNFISLEPEVDISDATSPKAKKSINRRPKAELKMEVDKYVKDSNQNQNIILSAILCMKCILKKIRKIF